LPFQFVQELGHSNYCRYTSQCYNLSVVVVVGGGGGGGGGVEEIKETNWCPTYIVVYWT